MGQEQEFDITKKTKTKKPPTLWHQKTVREVLTSPLWNH